MRSRLGIVLKWSIPSVMPRWKFTLKRLASSIRLQRLGKSLKMDPAYLGRIAARPPGRPLCSASASLKDRIYDDFKDTVGDIVTGTVRRRERGDLIIDLGKAKQSSPRERVPGEDYSIGDSIRCLLLKIEQTNREPDIILSAPILIRRLFELEVTEIADGTVTIEAMARSRLLPRLPCAVPPKVDPVGACVGARGTRVKTIVRELGGEKIDVMPTLPTRCRCSKKPCARRFKVFASTMWNAVFTLRSPKTICRSRLAAVALMLS